MSWRFIEWERKCCGNKYVKVRNIVALKMQLMREDSVFFEKYE